MILTPSLPFFFWSIRYLAILLSDTVIKILSTLLGKVHKIEPHPELVNRVICEEIGGRLDLKINKKILKKINKLLEKKTKP